VRDAVLAQVVPNEFVGIEIGCIACWASFFRPGGARLRYTAHRRGQGRAKRRRRFILEASTVRALRQQGSAPLVGLR